MSTRHRMHPARTGDDTVLRWVVHHPAVDASLPGPRRPDSGPLRVLLDEGIVESVAVVGGAVIIRVDSPMRWRTIATDVRAALGTALDALDSGSETWLIEPNGTWADLPSVEDAQRVVDAAAGTVLAMHGGNIVVTAIDPPLVRVTLNGACNGCRSSDSTVLDLVAPALRALHPALEQVVAGATSAPHEMPGAVTVRRVGDRPPGAACH